MPCRSGQSPCNRREANRPPAYIWEFRASRPIIPGANRPHSVSIGPIALQSTGGQSPPRIYLGDSGQTPRIGPDALLSPGPVAPVLCRSGQSPCNRREANRPPAHVWEFRARRPASGQTPYYLWGQSPPYRVVWANRPEVDRGPVAPPAMRPRATNRHEGAGPSRGSAQLLCFCPRGPVAVPHRERVCQQARSALCFCAILARD